MGNDRVEKLPASRILLIPENRPELLFSAPDKVKAEWRELAKIWHPDINHDADAAAVLAHINILAAAAEKKADAGVWESPDSLELRGADKKIRKVATRKSHQIEIGDVAYGETKVAWLIRNDFADLVHVARKTIAGFTFRHDAMKTEMSRFLPTIRADFETVDKRCVLIGDKTNDVFMLRDVVTALRGAMDVKHVAWVVSGLYNVACYLEFASLTHNGIDSTSVFISPKNHGVLLLGGWWYSARVGSKLNALPSRIHQFTPPGILAAKVGDPILDLTSIKILARELLGDITGMRLPGMGIPKPIVDFLRAPTGSSAVNEYTAWQAVLKSSFGPRRFTELVINESDIWN